MWSLTELCGTNWIKKQNRVIEESRKTAKGVEGRSKKEKGLMDMDNSVVTTGEGHKGLNGNTKKFSKKFLKR